jgi:hypothetical protein
VHLSRDFHRHAKSLGTWRAVKLTGGLLLLLVALSYAAKALL